MLGPSTKSANGFLRLLRAARSGGEGTSSVTKLVIPPPTVTGYMCGVACWKRKDHIAHDGAPMRLFTLPEGRSRMGLGVVAIVLIALAAAAHVLFKDDDKSPATKQMRAALRSTTQLLWKLLSRPAPDGRAMLPTQAVFSRGLAGFEVHTPCSSTVNRELSVVMR